MSVWPSPSQDLLLRAALLPDERAGTAWKAIRPTIDIATLDAGTAGLLPVLRHNLLARGVDDELLALFKGVHRHSWARTQLLLAPLLPVVAALERAGLPTLLLKGGAFIADRRLDAGMRAMNDLDVLVPTERRDEAIAVLLDHGLVPVDGAAPWYVAEHVPRYSPGYAFRDAHDRQLDLHWHVLHASCQPDADDDFWAASVPIELLGVRSRALCPADELLLVVLHGLQWSSAPGLRWVVDGALLTSGAFGAVDYERLLEQAAARRVSATLHAGLRYLRRVADAAVPEPVLRRLAAAASPLERLELRAQTTSPQRRTALAHRLLLHEQHLRRRLPLGARASLHRRLRLERERVAAGPGSEGAATVGGATPASAPAVSPGTTLDFRDPEVVRGHVAHGTWRNEPGGCWIAGREARIVVPLDQPAGTMLALDLRAVAFGPGGRLRMTEGGATLAEARTDGPLSLTAVRPRGAPTLDLRLLAPDHTSQRELGIGDDDRQISFHLDTLTVREPPLVAAGEAFDLLGEGHLAGGWHAADHAGRWTDGRSSRLMARLAHVPERPALDLTGLPFTGRSGVCVVDVMAGGELVGTLRYGHPAMGQVRRVRLRRRHFGPAGDVLIELRPHAPRSPYEEGLGEDRRLLGLCLTELTFQSADAS